MFTLIKGGDVYDPIFKGKQDIFICMGKIASVSSDPSFILEKNSDQLKTITADHLIIVPGFIDQHMHFLGGGGKLGYRSRAVVINYRDIIKYGGTTAIGSLGVDSYLIQRELPTCKGGDEGIFLFLLVVL